MVDSIFFDQLKVQAHEQPVGLQQTLWKIASYYQQADGAVSTLLEEVWIRLWKPWPVSL